MTLPRMLDLTPALGESTVSVHMRALPIRVLLVDDQPSVRRGLQMRLAIESDLTVIGEAADGEQGVALAISLQPDIVLMDVELPRLDGLAATRAIKAAAPHIDVIILTLIGDPELRSRASTAGAVAFVEKSAGDRVLLEAIRGVAQKRTNVQRFS
jgi:two-component system, NarL family, response regulator LiaR